MGVLGFLLLPVYLALFYFIAFRVVSKNSRPQLQSQLAMTEPTSPYSQKNKTYNRYTGSDALSATFVQQVVTTDGNTKAEIQRKIGEYFLAGIEAVWVVDPFRRVVVVHTSAEDFVTLEETDTLDGGTVFPGLDLPLARIFEQVPLTKRRTQRKKS